MNTSKKNLFAILTLMLAIYGVAPSMMIAQTPPGTAPQQDATRPPSTGTTVPAPATARPGTPAQNSPTTPPGTAPRPTPQTSPGVAPSPGTPVPSRDATPQSTPTPASPGQTGGAEESLPLNSLLKSRSVPPLPSLVRLGISGDQAVTLTLNEAVRRALENNNDIEIARGDVRRTESELLSLEAFYDPVFSFVPQLNNRVTPIASALGGSDRSGKVTTTDLNFDAAIVKPFRTGGGQYQFFFNNTRETTSSTFSQLNPFYSSNSGVTFTQPLLRNRAIDLNRRLIRVQRKRLQLSDADFRRMTTSVIADVQRAYWDLVFALRDQQNRTSNLQLARTLFLQTEQRIEAGSSAPFERAEIETELSTRESDLLASSQRITAAEVTLKLLILRDPLAPEWSAALIPVDTPAFDAAPVNLDDALRDARANRPELARLKTQREISDLDLQYFKNQARPRVDIEATVSTTGLAGSPVVPTGSINGDTLGSGTGGQIPLISGDPRANSNAFLLAQLNQLRAGAGLAPADVPLVTTETSTLPETLVGGYGRTLRNLVGLGTRNIVVGVRIEIPFRNRRARADLATARIEREQLMAVQAKQEQLVEAEVRLAAQGVETARRLVLTARAARRSAELQLEGERSLYEVGRTTTFLLFQRENALTNARNLELRAQTDYNKSLASLQQATATGLTAYNVILDLTTDR
ncbi:MAG: TolC family protein [Acidobacteria bacterium]|nr:TolC family protein [Acidobacteriota bacterium]